MPRRAATITQAEIQRAIRAAKKEGLPEIKLYLKDQTVIVIPITDTKNNNFADEEIIL